jgi:hypothetical protein
MKVCKTCWCAKPTSDFPKGTGHLNVLAHCKPCRAAKMRKYVTPEMRRKYHTKHQYGLTPEQLAAMHAAAGGKCAICELPCAALHIDHCHHTGTVRGLLCRSCNTGIGHLMDNTDNLLRAVSYLRAFERRS